MECHPLNHRTLFLLTALAAVLLVLSFAGGYYSGLLNAPEPSPSEALTGELLTAFLEAPPSPPARPTGDNQRPLTTIPPEANETRSPAERPIVSAVAPPPPPPSPREETASAPLAPPSAATPPAPKTAADSTEESPIIGYSVQVGSYAELPNADESVQRWKQAGYSAFIYHTTSSSGRRWHTVRIGRFDRREQAAEMTVRLRRESGVQAVTVPLVRR